MFLTLHERSSFGVPTAPTLDRPVISLAEHVQTAMGSFFTIHQKFLLNKKVPRDFLDKLKEEKQEFKCHCENMQQALLSYYRHAADYATFSQRAVDDRLSSAKRCLSSAKDVHRVTQELCRAFQIIVTTLNERKPDLARYLKISGSHQSASVPDMEQLPLGDQSALQMLYSSIGGVQECLRDIVAFWDYHIASLVLLIKGETNYPSPGDEAKAIFQLWMDYQVALLQSSNSISASADALTITPRGSPIGRSNTLPTTLAEKTQHRASFRNSDESMSQPFRLKNLTIKIVEPFQNFGKYIMAKMVGNEPRFAT